MRMATIFDTKRIDKDYKGFTIKGVIRPKTLTSTWTAYMNGKEAFSAGSESRLKAKISDSLKVAFI